MTLHLSIIACFNWLFVGVYIIYTKVSSKKEGQPLSDVDVLLVKAQPTAPTPMNGNEDTNGKPLIRLYVFAYGIASFVVAITASSGANNYSHTGFCFIGNGKLFVNFIFIFYARWRF